MSDSTTLDRPSPVDSSYSWLRLAISLTLSTIGGVGIWAIIPVLPTAEADFGVTRAESAFAYTMTMVGFAAGNLIFGRVVDRYGICVTMILASIMLAAGFYAASLADTFFTFSILHALLIGSGTAAGFGPMIADISHWFKKRRGIAIAAGASGNYLAGTVWPIFLSPVITEQGWRETYELVAVICLLTMVPLALLLRRKPPAESLAEEGKGGIAGPSQQLGISPAMLQGLLVFAGVACCVAMSMPQVHIIAYCLDLGYGLTAGAEMLSIMLGAGVISRLICGALSDYIGAVRTVLLSSSLQCFALFLYLPFDGLMPLYIVSLIFGLSQGGIVPGYALIIREYLPAREAGQRVGMIMMATILGMALGGYLSGVIYELTGSYQAAFLHGIAWNVANMAILFLILVRSRPNKEPLAA